jgi:cardiolipin synthase (CMP-forming)
MPHIIPFIVYVGLLIFTMSLSLLKFKRFPSLHLYSWKIGGYIQGLFLVVLFGYDFVAPLYYFMIIWSILATLEHILLQLYVPRLISNAKGLYWVIRDRPWESGT